MESVSYWNLDVTVVRAKTKTHQDYFSKSDLYVILLIPTATTIRQKTKTIHNDQHPEWNETFTFRIPSQTKNVLEMAVLDKDYITSDDLVSTVKMDLGIAEVGTKVSREVVLDEEHGDVLELELELRSSDEEPVQYPSNGILVAPPLSTVDITVEKLEHNHFFISGCVPMLRLGGAFEDHLEIKEEKLQFHVNRDLETELELTEVEAESEAKEKHEVSLSSVTVKPFPPQHSENVSLTLDGDTVDLKLEAQETPKEQLAARLEFDIPPEEKAFLWKRKRIVAKALEALLGLDSPLSDEQVPTIAVVASGGGSRACTATLGALKGLKELGVLDTVTYITAVSGATWSVSRLCQEEKWSQNLDPIIFPIRENITNNSEDLLTVERLQCYHQEMEEKEQQGHLVSYVDMAGLIVEHIVYGQKHTSTLTDQQKSVNEGLNPFPIYSAVHSIEPVEGRQFEAEWAEFTPFEVGLQKYGVFVKAEDFGSKFFLGHLIERLPEIRLPFLLGIWSSIFSYTLRTILQKLTGADLMWTNDETVIHNIEESTDSTLDTVVVTPDSGLSATFSAMFQNRPILNETFNFIRGLSMHQDYSHSSNFLTSKDLHPDGFPNQLTPSQPVLRLIDSGLSIKVACPPVLRPERLADVIIILGNGWDHDNPFVVIEKTADFCKEHKIPFPGNADYEALRQQPLKEMYVFEDPETPKAPIVLHLPLVNASFKEYKAPGVPRETPEELAEGQVDVSSEESPYTTSNLTYSPQDFDALLHLTTYNVLTSRDTILSAIRRALDRK